MAFRGRPVTAAQSLDESGAPEKARGGVLAMAAQIDAAIAMRRIAMPERPNSGRVPRPVGERPAGWQSRPASAAAEGQGRGRLPGRALPAAGPWSGTGPFQAPLRGGFTAIRAVYRACGRDPRPRGYSHATVTLQKRHFQAHPAANSQLPRFESRRQAPARTCGGGDVREGPAGQGRGGHATAAEIGLSACHGAAPSYRPARVSGPRGRPERRTHVRRGTRHG
jgi:hypothetical protein